MSLTINLQSFTTPIGDNSLLSFSCNTTSRVGGTSVKKNLWSLFRNRKSRATTAFSSKPLFLDRYGAHFSAIQANFISHQFGHLTYNLSPDAEAIKPSHLFKYKTPMFGFTPIMGSVRFEDFSLVNLFKKSSQETTRAAVWQVVSGLRYGWRVEGAQRTYVLPFRNRATGFIRTGRTQSNLSTRLRYGASMRAALSLFYSSKNVPSAYYGKVIASKYGLTLGESAGAFFSGRGSGYSKLFDKNQLEFATISAVGGVNSLRTVWYATNRFLSSRFSQMNLAGLSSVHKSFSTSGGITGAGTDVLKILKLMVNSGIGTNRVSGDLFRRGVDSATFEHFRERKQMRHANHRIVVGRAERKLWNYKKTRQYWRFMRWVSHFFFKGLCYLRFFTLRVDVFLVNHLRVRNIALSRLFVRGGHAFIGDRACLNPAQFVGKYDIVSLSREVTRWLNYRRLVGGVTATSNRNIWGSSSRRRLRFARATNLAGVFHGHYSSFAVLHGSFMDLINTEPSRVSNAWGSFTYFQGQRVVASAWW